MHERIKARREAVSVLQNARQVLGELAQSAPFQGGGYSSSDFLRALRDLGTNEDDGAGGVGSVGQDDRKSGVEAMMRRILKRLHG